MLDTPKGNPNKNKTNLKGTMVLDSPQLRENMKKKKQEGMVGDSELQKKKRKCTITFIVWTDDKDELDQHESHKKYKKEIVGGESLYHTP